MDPEHPGNSAGPVSASAILAAAGAAIELKRNNHNEINQTPPGHRSRDACTGPDTYQGVFPVEDTGEDGFAGISPVGAFPANGYGLYDMAGNVWQWCSDWYRPDYFKQLAEDGNVARNPQGPEMPFDPDEPTEKKRVQKGGSFLCTDQYCTRYMVGTRGKGEVNSATNHIGFRCVLAPQGSAEHAAAQAAQSTKEK